MINAIIEDIYTGKTFYGDYRVYSKMRTFRVVKMLSEPMNEVEDYDEN